jgi:uncharacterized membrane protein
MKQTKLFHLLFPFIMMAIPWIYLGIIWNELPQTIPTHFGISGEPDKFGAKNEILIAPLIITVTGLLMYFILRNIHKIDPKKKYTATTSAVMKKLAVVIIILLCAASLFVIHSTLKGKIEGLSVLLCGMGLLLAYIGNLMHSIKPNYFAGIRVPWALENEENWRKTHQLASKIWFIGGIVLAIAALILNLQAIAVVFISAVLIMTLIPVIYSYNLYRKQSNTK